MLLRNYTTLIALLFLWQCASGEYIPHDAYNKVRNQINNSGTIRNNPPRVITPRGNVVPHVPYDNDADYYLPRTDLRADNPTNYYPVIPQDNDADYYLPRTYDPRLDNPTNHYPIIPRDNDADYYLPPDYNADNQDGIYIQPMVFD